MVIGDNSVAEVSGHPHIDVSESIVIEYPVPAFEGEYKYFPRLAIATLEKEKDKDKDKDKEKKDGGEGGSGGEKGSVLRRRGMPSHSQLNSSTSALLSPESPTLTSSPSSTPLLLTSSSTSPYDGLELDTIVYDDERREGERVRSRSHSLATTATQTSPSISPSHAFSSTTTTTTTTTSSHSVDHNNKPSPPHTPTYLNKTRRRNLSIAEKPNINKEDSDRVTNSTDPSSSPPSSRKTPESSPTLSPLNSPSTSSTSLLSKIDKDSGWHNRNGSDDDELL